MKLYVTGASYNVIGFDGDDPFLLITEPVVVGGTTINPGDCITAIISNRTSAGFGSFELAPGSKPIQYLGMYRHADKHGDKIYLLFDYPFQRDLFGSINGHQHAYVTWALFSDGNLFYEIRHNGRVIVPTEVRFYQGEVDTGQAIAST